MNKTVLLAGAAAAAALFVLSSRKASAKTVDAGGAVEADRDRVVDYDSAPSAGRAPTLGTTSKPKGSLLEKLDEGTQGIARGASTALGAGAAALGKWFGKP